MSVNERALRSWLHEQLRYWEGRNRAARSVNARAETWHTGGILTALELVREWADDHCLAAEDDAVIARMDADEEGHQ